MAKINVLDKEVTVYSQNNEDYICLTDIVAIYKTLIYNIIGGKMTTLTVRINDNRAEALKVKAEQYGTPLEDLLIASMENLLSQPAGDFERTMEYVLCKNRELYRRPQVGSW